MFFVTVPHHSLSIPPSLKDRINPDARMTEIAEPGIDTIFSWDDVPIVKAHIHQCFANLNRSRDDINPRTNEEYPQTRSIFPEEDFHGTPLYLPGKELTEAEKEKILREEYDKFHQGIDALIDTGSFSFFIDAHAMNSRATSYKKKIPELKSRPQICISNNGDEHGEGEQITFPSVHARALMEALRAKGYETELNYPFRGGYIIQEYCDRIPCLQIELLKKLYMTSDSGEVLEERAKKLHTDLFDVLHSIAL